MQDLKPLVTGDNHFGSLALRVLDVVTPLNGAGAPAENAKFIGQMYVDTTADKQYFSVAIDSTSPADDWVLVTSA